MSKKKKVINVTYRKDSETFPKWMKYEIELLNEDGTTERIPAYGRDLQDALSRVVHDTKVEKVSKVVDKVPTFVWPLVWLAVMGILGLRIIENQHEFGDWVGLIFIGSMLSVTLVTLGITKWFEKKNLVK
jgi:hypothetical protein